MVLPWPGWNMKSRSWWAGDGGRSKQQSFTREVTNLRSEWWCIKKRNGWTFGIASYADFFWVRQVIFLPQQRGEGRMSAHEATFFWLHWRECYPGVAPWHQSLWNLGSVNPGSRSGITHRWDHESKPKSRTTHFFIRIRSSLQLAALVTIPFNYWNEQMYSVGLPWRYFFGPKGAISQGM